MVTLKECEIYLKVNKFIETENCDENDIIPKTNQWGWNYSLLCSINDRIR